MAMTAITVRRGLTWQDFLDLPDLPEYRHAELVNGELVVSSPSALHQQVLSRLNRALGNWTDAAPGRGEVTYELPVRIADDRGYKPDLMWYRQEQCAPPGQPPAFDGPPTLVVEVLSPSTRRLDAVRKRADYARIGVRELWLIDCEVPEALLARQQDAAAGSPFADAADLDGDGTLSSPLLPGFAIRLGDLVER